MRQEPPRVAAQQLQVAYDAQRIGNGRKMPRARRIGEGFLGKAPRPRDLAERPKRQSEEDHAGDTDVLAEAEGEGTVQLGIVGGERLLEMLPSAHIITLT